MIIIADVPFFDAFNYASSLSESSDLSYWSPDEYVPSVKKDIFSESEQSNVCLISKLSSKKDIETACSLTKTFKAIVIWDSDFDSVRNFCSVNKLEHKFVQIPKYISLRESISKCNSISKEAATLLASEIDQVPLSSRLHRDFVSSIIHKISVIYSDKDAKCNVADLTLGSPVSMLDITSAFCMGEEHFFSFCYYYFSKNEELDSSLKSWISLVNKFLISNGDAYHEIYRSSGIMSVKLNEAINNKLLSCIKGKDFLYCLMCVSYILKSNSFHDFVFSVSLMRSSISEKLSKKQSINIIRNLNE